MSRIETIQQERNIGCGLIARTDLTLKFHADRAIGFDHCRLARQHEYWALGTPPGGICFVMHLQQNKINSY